jgi:phenylpropionate dioxygenase-like ring-hydroxylating dioxygenase large terminal subunit
MKNFPYTQFPSGWFHIAWSADLAPGDVKPVKYFDMDFVLMRTESGKVALADAFCPHMGAHLGYGGKIEGEKIRCPFHGWAFEADGGAIAEVPYADSDKRPRVCIKNWPVRDSMGMVLLWHDANGAPPSWDPPAWPEPDSGDYYFGPEARKFWPLVHIQPQLVIENIVDAAHQVYVHRAKNVSDFDQAEAKGPMFHAVQAVVLGEGKGKTWLTERPTAGKLSIEGWGLGIGLVRYIGVDNAIIIHTSTPIDHESSVMHTAMLVPKTEKFLVNGELTEHAKQRFAHHFLQVERDLPIWNNMSYVTHPPFAGVEVPTFIKFRAWAKRFYPEGAASGAARTNAA